MKSLKFYITLVIETLLRVLPFRTQTGLIKIGNPTRKSPVLLTGNYHLTVELVKRALKGIDAHLLVANSRGVNVWCAATGGLFTNHDVISVLKTSGIEELVDHKEIILPQLAATGIELKTIRKKTGWKVTWGPVYAKDIPAFLEKDGKITPQIRMVAFPWTQRLEMAVAWAFPISFVAALILLPFWSQAILPVAALVWTISFLIFLAFPFYEHHLSSEGRRIGFVFFDFGRGGFQLILWAVFLLGLAVFCWMTEQFTGEFFLRWGLISLVIIILVSIDLMGSTPTYKSGLHEDRLLKIFLDIEKCKGAGFCEQVCPRNCYAVDKKRHTATMPGAERCIQCGACIVQCPFDALYFLSPTGKIILPETVRKFKLNLLGKREEIV